MIKWLYKSMPRDKQKEFVINALDDLLSSKDSSIDQLTAISLIEKITASKGNTITAFIMKEK